MAGSCQLEACMVRQPFRPFQGSLPLLARSIPERWRIKDIPEQFKSAVVWAIEPTSQTRLCRR